ncbi:hypothetical protein [Xanthomonas oryzae]|uniref:hypothetical protein n=1 Tax=Xanthomonas oryzae TaxID=347 RepID=UPI0021DAC097|nr:hypothetical protein [Xanthomonas oryzae]
MSDKWKRLRNSGRSNCMPCADATIANDASPHSLASACKIGFIVQFVPVAEDASIGFLSSCLNPISNKPIASPSSQPNACANQLVRGVSNEEVSIVANAK